MTLHAPGHRRERILGYGESNSGKSTKWLNIAEWIHKTGSDAKVFLVDTDRTWEALEPIDGHLASVVVPFDAPQYPDMKDAVKEAAKRSKSRDDWLVFDMIDKLWVKSQRHYFDEAFDSDLGDYFLAAKTGGPSVAGEYGTNWNVVNKLYQDVWDGVFYWKGHLFAAAPAAEIRQPNQAGKGGDDIKIRQLFGDYGFKPQGQKDLPHAFHTILFCQETPSGWRWNQVKDRQRERSRGVVDKDFVMSYLIPKAGWKP